MRLTKSLESKVRLARTSEVKRKKDKEAKKEPITDLKGAANLMKTKSSVVADELSKVIGEEPAITATKEAIVSSTKEIMTGEVKTKEGNNNKENIGKEDNKNIISTPEKLHYRLHSSLQSQQFLKQQMWQLQQDNLALRELCCFLQEDRLKARKTSEEWRKFGEHSANVMRSELKHYQNKLELLEAKQEMLLEENLRLKEEKMDEDKKGNDKNKKSNRSGFECPACGDNIVAVEANAIMMSSADNSADSCYWTEGGSSVAEGVSCSDAESNAKARLVMDVFELANEQLADEHVEAEKNILVEMCNVVWRSLEN